MEFKSIFVKMLFFLTIGLAILCCINNNIINKLTKVCVIPLFIINVLIVIDSINTNIVNITSKYRQYYKEFENDNTICKTEQKEQIKKEIIYDEICNLFEIKVNRIISNLMIITLVFLFLLMIFNQYMCDKMIDLSSFISILSCTLLIVDISYKEKIAKKIIDKLYKHEEKIFKDNKI